MKKWGLNKRILVMDEDTGVWEDVEFMHTAAGR